MDLKIKTATVRYQRGANTKAGYLTMGSFLKEMLGNYVQTTYNHASRKLIVMKALGEGMGGKLITPYPNAKYPFRVYTVAGTPISGGIELQLTYDEKEEYFWAVLPEKLPAARSRSSGERKQRVGDTASVSRINVPTNTAFRDKAFKARTDLVTAVGKLNGSLWAVCKETGEEVQIIPSSIKIKAKIAVVTYEEQEL